MEKKTTSWEKDKRLFHGIRIRERRKQIHLSQNRLAELLGTSQSSICEYETGRSSPSLKVLCYLAIVLNTSTDYLLGLTDNPHPFHFSQAITDTERDLLQVFYSLPLEKRKRAVGILIGLRDG